MRRHLLDFDTLLAPLTTEEFFDAYWQRRPMLHTAGDPTRFEGLLSLADVDHLVSSLTRADSDWIILIKNAGALPQKAYSTDEKTVNLSAIYRAYEAGHTLLLTKLEKRRLPVAHLCRRLEVGFVEHNVALSKRIGANMYLTPADSQGFPPHYDSHDTLILQLEGTKRWRIYGTREPFPIESQTSPLPADKLPPLQKEFTIEPGHVMYIPRGFYHDAQTTGGHSLHLTLGLYTHTWVDLVFKLIMDGAPFREAMPAVRFDEGGRLAPEFVEEFKRRVELLSKGEGLEAAVSELFNRFPDNLEMIPGDGFRQLNDYKAIGPGTLVAKREGAAARVRRQGGECRLTFSGGGFGGSEQLEPVFRFILDADVFAVRDLPCVPSDEVRLKIVGKLIQEGLLKIVREA